MASRLTILCVAVAAVFPSDLIAQDTKEIELLAILTSDAPKSEKAITCKHLAIHGTRHSVPELAKLLPDAQLNSWARTALEVIPDPDADEALRSAMNDLDSGLPLVGVINSIAVRGDEKAVDGLTRHLNNENEQVAVAAAIALGKIGNAAGQRALTGALAHESEAVRSAAAEGCILIAERLLESDQPSKAAVLYDHVREADAPTQRRLEATRGLVLANKSADLVLELLRSQDKDEFGLGLRTAREMPDSQITDALVAALETASPIRQSLIVLSLADRDRASVLPAILRVAKAKEANVRRNAFEVLGRVGDASTVETLLVAATDTDSTVALSAREALSALRDARVDKVILDRLSAATGKTREAIIQTIGARQIHAVPELIQATQDADSSIRAAALAALGATVGPQDLSKLIQIAVKPKYASDAEPARTALLVASTRMPDREACATELANAISNQPPATQAAIIEVLGQVGGTRALQTVASAAADERDQLKDAASRTLGKWMTPDAAPELLKLAKPRADEKYRIRALRGYLRIARQMKLTPAQRASMCESALEVAARKDEQALALKVLEIHPSVDTLAVALNAKKIPALKKAAHETALRIASRIQGQSDEVMKLLEQGELEPAKIEILKATYGAGQQQVEVTDIVRKSVGKLPIVGLDSPSYNNAFNGDPAPGVVKQLAIEYKINGQRGEVSFAENAPIILPAP